MKVDVIQDIKDSQEIKRQKIEQDRSTERMSKWVPGKGIVESAKDGKKNVRNSI